MTYSRNTHIYTSLRSELKVHHLIGVFKRILLSSRAQSDVVATVERMDGGGSRSLCTTPNAIGAQHATYIQ